MKRYVRSSDYIFPKTGSAGPANARAGVLKFGSGKSYNLGNGYIVEFPTGVVRIDVNSGELSVYCNIYVYREEDRHGAANEGFSYHKEYVGYTMEEAEQLFNALKNMSTAEIEAEIKHNSSAWR